MINTKYFLFLSLATIMLSSTVSSLPMAHATGNQVTLNDLAVLQLAAHDLFNVDRGDGSSAAVATDFENGKLDLSTLFIDMKSPTLESFSDEDIDQGGEPRNRENIILFSVASRIGQTYTQNVITHGEQQARLIALDEYHSMFNTAYMNAFGESVTNPIDGCVTMTENLAFRTVHDFLPGTILKDGNPDVGIFTLLPPFSDNGLTDDELMELSSMLDGNFDLVFTEPLDIIIIPGIAEIHIPSLLGADNSFAFQFNTEFPFESTAEFPFAGITGFLNELQSGSYTSTNALDQIRSLIAKGYGNGCYIGGEIIPIDATSLILAGAQSFSWMIPVVLSVLGIGLFTVSRKSA